MLSSCVSNTFRWKNPVSLHAFSSQLQKNSISLAIDQCTDTLLCFFPHRFARERVDTYIYMRSLPASNIYVPQYIYIYTAEYWVGFHPPLYTRTHPKIFSVTPPPPRTWHFSYLHSHCTLNMKSSKRFSAYIAYTLANVCTLYIYIYTYPLARANHMYPITFL